MTDNGDQWSFAALLVEAWRNLLSARSRVFPVLLLAVAAGVVAAASMIFSSVTFTSLMQSRFTEGRTVLVFEAGARESPVTISRVSCERLSEIAGVRASGFVLAEGRSNYLPGGAEVPVNRVSTTILHALSDGYAVFGPNLLTPSGATFRYTSGGDVLTGVQGSPQPEGVPTNSAVSVPLRATDHSASACTVVLAPFAQPEHAIPALRAALEMSGGDVVARRVSNDTINPLDQYLNRAERFLPLLLGLGGGLVQALINRTRRFELAAYRLSGTSQRSLLVLLCVEAAIAAGAVAASFSGLALLAAGELRGLLAPALSAVAMAAMWFVTSVTASLPVANASAAELARDR